MAKGTLTDWLRQHVWCVMVVFLVILVANTALYFSSDAPLVDAFGLAGSIASIILALVAILYGAISAWRSKQNVGEMRHLIEDGQSQLDRRAGQMVSAAEDLNRQAAGLGAMLGSTSPLTEEPEDEAKPLQGNYSLDLHLSSYTYVLVVYAVAKAGECEKIFVSRDAAEIIFREKKAVHDGTIFVAGITGLLRSFLGGDNISSFRWVGKSFEWDIKAMPDILGHCQETIEAMIIHPELSAETKAFIERVKTKIDDHFASSAAEAQSK